ncbi:latent-transforming growth factor beta-binding protein 2-like isoform X2 [Leucoraja erinacea]|uniref:latent-transforming growth factor beta-binding protein 2-like isoform X2 n=1 Tax=Leucoraja erinaceus TaxID=7782 RepID=UPI002457AF25|nr:latent-transforming growth factor beta-binding protein 2-like isoform X2 [Leucoraja erinacea]
MGRSWLEICITMLIVLGLSVPSESQRDFRGRSAQLWGLRTGHRVSNLTVNNVRLPGHTATLRGQRNPERNPASSRLPSDAHMPVLYRAASQMTTGKRDARETSTRRAGVNGQIAAGTGRTAHNPPNYNPVTSRRISPVSVRASRPITSRISALSSRERSRTHLGTAQGDRHTPWWPGRTGFSSRNSGFISDASSSSSVSLRGANPVSPVRASMLASGASRTRLAAGASQSRSRQFARQNQGRRAPSRRLIGPNVCGKQCCSGWSVSQSTNRCMKPVCDPPCQNRGSCSRPQVCVCRSGFRGSRCEEVVPEQPYNPRGLSSRSLPSRLSASNLNAIQQIDDNAKNNTKRMKQISSRRETSLIGHTEHLLPQTKYGQLVNTQKLTGTSRMVKHLSNGNGQLLSNSLFNNGQAQVQNRFATNGQVVAENENALPRGANLTMNVGTIKIVFTPTICKRQCRNGKCHNSCKKGDPTTLYSENGYGPVSKSGFRIYFCQIPCLNGGYCIGRDKCWCPSNSTGKFCHLPVLHKKQIVTRIAPADSSNTQSVYTLPLSNQPVVMHPSLVNIHVNHPPEATVQIHQVARVKTPPDSSPKKNIKNSLEQLSVHSVQQRSQPNNSESHSRQPQVHRRPMTMGRCFQETADGQCEKPLPGLTKQDDCCGSVGSSWGYHKCTQCPPKLAHQHFLNGQFECPLGYKKVNQTYCQDINECLMTGLCQNANCLNTRGSYRCTCNPGYMLDTSRSHCISDKAVSAKLGPCFRSLSNGNCSLPLSQQIAKQICCCSRVGKAWGKNCEKCPLPGSAVFNEICPAGHGYHYSRSHVQILMRPAEEEEISQVILEQHLDNQQSTAKDSKLTSKEEHYVNLEGYDTSIKTSKPFVTTHAPSVGNDPVEEVVKTSPAIHVQIVPEHTGEQVASVLPEEIYDINICEVSPNVCGPGICINRQVGYTCDCDTGYQLDNQQNKCVDINECREIPQLCSYGQCGNTAGGYRCTCLTGFVLNRQGTDCLDINECETDACGGNGHCINILGTYTCSCFTGYTLVISQGKQNCQDINECEQANICNGHRCVNIPGSYVCDCEEGYILTRPGNCSDSNECLMPGICTNGGCVNMEGSFRCTCNQGFEPVTDQKNCIDIDECLTRDVCFNGLCTNTEGSYTCSICNPGYSKSENRLACEDIDECESLNACFNGLCVNTEGSYTCSNCNSGYSVSKTRQTCEDIDECESLDVCFNGLCINTEGSYSCSICNPGYRLSENRLTCEDINECLTQDICGPNGECINNEEGSYYCLCAQGYTTTPDRTSCEDVNECSEETKCLGGTCINTDGSYMCRCETGFTHLPEAEQCTDIDECSLYANASPCGIWKCENTIGSFQCIMACQPGFQRTAIGNCIDVDECVNETICGTHGYCMNTGGSFHCLCDQGFEVPLRGQACVDINECEMMNGACGTALCENFEGSFFCECMDENEFFDPAKSQCVPHEAMVIGRVPDMTAVSESSMMPEHTKGDLKECYYNLNDENFCDNLLSRNITKGGCCCTVGVGWGDNCEVHPCPLANTEAYKGMCPDGKGFIPFQIGSFAFGSQNYGDADECTMFGSEVCKNGHCVNTRGSYSCYCDAGSYYDNVRLGCTDIDECQDENMCVNGECVNTPGSFNCFCNPPLILHVTGEKCVNGSESGVDFSEEGDAHLNICWQAVTEAYVCSKPLRTRSTYTECCCMYGVAWGLDCAFCPPRTSNDFAQLCNVPRTFGDGSDRSGFEFGHETPSRGEDSQRGIGSYDNYLRPEYGPYDSQYGAEYGQGDRYFGSRYGQSNPQPDSGFELRDSRLTAQYGPTDSQRGLEYGSREYSRIPQHRPQEPLSIPLFSSSDNERSSSFEGLQAEECGILNGCENGRCVRVQEGYTCDCFDGFELDMTKMTCGDINECEDLSDTIPLCRNANCENTEGSYKCICLPGYMLSQNSNDCILEVEAGHQ